MRQHAQAQTLLDQTSQYINGGDRSPERLRTLTCVPWPDEQVEPALSVIDQHWETLSEDDRQAAMRIVPRASDEFGLLQQFHNRIANAVNDNPSGAVGRIAADEASRMDSAARALVFGSAVGKHTAVTSTWATLDTDSVAKVIVDNAQDADAVTGLLEALTVDRHAAAAATLHLMASTADMPETAVQAVSIYCTQDDLSQAAQTAIQTLTGISPQTSGALRVIIAAREKRAEVDTDRIQERAEALLSDATPEIARLLGRSLNGIRQGSGLKDTLASLRRDANTRSIAGAFDAGYRA